MIRPRTDAALKIIVGLVISGAILGAVWAVIAPPIHTITGLAKSGDRVDGFLGREADNVFVASAMFIGLLCMLGVVTAVAVWQWRAYRGPLMVVATPRDVLGGWPPARTWGTVGPRITAAGTEPVHPA